MSVPCGFVLDTRLCEVEIALKSAVQLGWLQN